MSMQGTFLSGIISAFPPVRHAFGYGSGVFHQPDLYQTTSVSSADQSSNQHQLGEGPQLDLILAVDDPLEWHRQNISVHRRHYSMIASLGPRAVAAVGEHLGVGVFFNTLVPWGEHYIKYGVVSLPTLERDLLQWDSLYCAGRLQKPVLSLREDPRVAAAQSANLLSALRVALLLLPERFSTADLLHTICALSYMGDLRVGLAEDSKKVHRIVEGSSTGLWELYRGPLRTAETAWGVLRPLHPPPGQLQPQGCSPAEHAQQRQQVESWRGARGLVWEQDMGNQAKASLVERLPQTLLRRMGQSAGVSYAPAQIKAGQREWRAELAQALVAPGHRNPLSWHVRHAVRSVVWRSSVRQLLAGLLSAGGVKSTRYVLSKMRKAWR